MRLWAAIPTVIGGFAYVILSIVGTALFLLCILKVNFTISVILASVIVFAYIYFGGMVATTFSTAFQGIAMTVGSLVAMFYVLGHYGGFNGLTDAVLANSSTFFNMPYVSEKASHPLMSTWTGVVGFFFVWHFGFSAMPYTGCQVFHKPGYQISPQKCFLGSAYWRCHVWGACYYWNRGPRS